MPKRIGRPPKNETPEIMQEKVDEYFKKMDKEGKPYTITGLALALDFSSLDSLLNFDRKGKEKKEFNRVIKKAKLRVQNQIENRLYTQRQVAGSIFSLKANYKWKDHVVVTGEDGNPIAVTITSFKKKG